MKLALPDWIRGTSIGAQVAWETAEMAATERGELAREVAELRRQRDRDLPELAKRHQKAQVRLQAARDTLAEARRLENAAQSASMSARSRFEHRIYALEGQLRASADPAIAEFIGELDELVLAGRAVKPETAKYGPQRSKEVSNHEGVVARLEAIREARKQAEALKLEVISSDEVAARIEAIRVSIPDVPPPEHYFPFGAKLWPPPRDDE